MLRGSCRSVLNCVAASISSSPWYSQKLEEFVNQIPAMLQHGPLKTSIMAELDRCVGVATDTKKLLDMTGKIPGLVSQLRHGSCNDLLEKFKCKVQSLWLVVSRGEVKCNEGELHALTKTLRESSIIFPMDADIQASAEDACKMLQEHGKTLMVNELLAACEVLSEGTTTLEELKVKCKAIEDMLDTNHVSKSALSESGVVTIQSALNRLWALLDSEWKLDEKPSDLVCMSLECMRKLACLDSQSTEQAVEAVSEGMAMAMAGVELTKILNQDVVEDEAVFNNIVLMHRRLMRYEKASHGVEAKPIIVSLNSSLTQAKNVVKHRQSTMLDHQKSKVLKAYRSLSDIAGGKPNGLDWLDNQDASWEDLLKAADKSIVLLSGEDLVQRQSTLDEACQTCL
eukprot:5796253-Amphidinium_carterae.6